MEQPENGQLGFSADPRIRLFQVEQVLKVMPLAVAVSFINAAIVVIGLYDQVDNKLLLAWFAAMTVLTLVRGALLLWGRSRDYRRRGYPGAEKAVYGAIIVSGLLWGSTSLLLYVHDNPGYQLFLAFVLAGMAAGSVVLLSQLFYPALVFTLLTLTPLILHLFTHPAQLSRPMGALLLVFTMALLTMAWFNYRTTSAGIVARLQDSDSRRQARDKLDRLMQQREQFFALCEDMMCVMNFDGYFVDLNPRWSEQLGYTEDELKTSPILSLVHPDDVPATLREIDLLSAGNYRTINFVNRFRDKSGDWHWVRWTAGARKDMQLIFAAVHDITDIKNQELQLEQRRDQLESQVQERTRSLQESERRLRYLLRESPAVIYTCEAGGSHAITYISPNVRALFGYEPPDFVNTPSFWPDNIHPDDRDRVFAGIEELFKQGWYHHDYRFRLGSGDYCWVRDELRLVRNEQGELVEIIGYWTNINDIRASEQALLETNNRFRAMVENAPEAFILLDNRGLVQDVNANACRMLGFSDTDLRGASLFASDLLVDEYTLRDHWTDVLEGGAVRMDIGLKCRGGDILPVEAYLNAYQSGEEQKVILLLRDISERLMREDELRAARDMALQASAAKTDFLSRMSHELRTPLNAITGFAQLLEMDQSLGRDVRQNVEEIKRAGNHLLELISEVLDLSRIEADRMEITSEELLAADLLQACAGMVKSMAAAREIILEVHGDGLESVWLKVDPTRMRQVLVNLLSNAVKYNRPGGKVLLSASFADDGMLKIEVRDTGIGIPADRQVELFQPFNRLVSDKAAVEGTGIGLVISRRLTEMMGGVMGFESTEGKGSRFWVEFPAHRREPEWKPSEPVSPAAADSSTADAVASGRDYRLLYIEDNIANRRLVERVFEACPGISLDCRGTADEGLACARSRHPDLVLLDIALPGADGYEVLQRLRADAGTRDIPVIAVSANAMDSDISRGKMAGFDDYITKPIDIQRLLSVVDARLNGRLTPYGQPDQTAVIAYNTGHDHQTDEPAKRR